MAKPWVCINCGFAHEPDEEAKTTRKHRKDKRNLYATRGREKLSELVAEVEKKKQRILNKIEPHEVLLVRFVYLDDQNELKPIIVREKGKKREQMDKKDAVASRPTAPERNCQNSAMKRSLEMIKSVKLKLKPSHGYMAFIAILILILLLLHRRQLQFLSN